jgi:hypothetical protein
MMTGEEKGIYGLIAVVCGSCFAVGIAVGWLFWG